MKILVLGLPRTGSKFITENLKHYLHYKNDSPELDSNIFGDYGMFGRKELFIRENKIYPIDYELKEDVFFKNRFDIIQNWPYETVQKFHYNELFNHQSFGLYELSTMMRMFDKVYVTKRENVFDQCMSAAIAQLTSQFTPGEEQDKVKKDLLLRPMTVDLDFWRLIVKGFMMSTTLDLPSTRDILADRVFDMTGPAFCAHLGLPYKIGFETIPSALEFGQAKYSMVTNLKRLQEIFFEYSEMEELRTPPAMNILFKKMIKRNFE